jgi:hypothetical protein
MLLKFSILQRQKLVTLNFLGRGGRDMAVDVYSTSRGLYYKTYYGRNLGIFVIS